MLNPMGNPESTVGYLGCSQRTLTYSMHLPVLVHIGGNISTDKPFDEQFGGNDEQSF